jgi:hypothetical protein
MDIRPRGGWRWWAAGLAAALAAGLLAAGCGTPGAPLPPSLNLADPVTDLAASRAGDRVSLAWTMPRKNTDRLLLKGDVEVRVCRKEGAGGSCVTTANLQLAPGGDGAFTEALPAALATGAPRPLTYFVELVNHRGRSAGLSNGAAVLAGEAPGPLTGLTAEERKDGILLRWTPAEGEPAQEVVRLERRLISPPAAKPAQGLLAPPAEPAERSLMVEAGAQQGRALDKEIRFGKSYEYRAQRVARVTVDGRSLELAGELSLPARVEALDMFPPSAPAGLAAVATAGGNGAEMAIDLSWQPDTEADLAGYIVYRRGETGEWQRISPAEPVVGPAFHDPHVEAGHSYSYAVSAIGQNGHESARSAEAQEIVPGP